jgi:hypothetical protein
MRRTLLPLLYRFVYAYIYDPRGLELLATSHFHFVFSKVEVSQFYFPIK